MAALGCLRAGLLALLLVGVVHAESLPELEIPRGTLVAQLLRLSELTGVAIVHAGDLGGIDSATSLSGPMSLEQALDRLLIPLNLAWQRLPDGAIRIESQGLSTASAVLGTLQVEASAEFDELPDPANFGALGLQDELAAVTRYSADDLAKVPRLGLRQLLRRSPNVYGSGRALALRGIERDVDSESTSALVLDGILLSGIALEAGLVPISELETLEFQRGPRSLGLGHGALGGAVVLNTPAPSPEREAWLRLRGESGGGHRVGAGVGGSPGRSDLSARLVLEQEHLPGSIDSPLTGRSDIDTERRQSLVARVFWEPEFAEALSVTLSAFSAEARLGDDRVVAPLASSQEPLQRFDPHDRVSFDRRQIDSRVSGDGGGLVVAWQPAQGHQFGLRIGHSVTSEDRRIAFPEEDLQTGDVSEREQRSYLDLRWQADLGDWRWLAVVGGDRRRLLQDEQTALDLRVFFPPAAGLTIQPNTRQINSLGNRQLFSGRSLLLNLERPLGRDWRLAAGLRALDESRIQESSQQSGLDRNDCRILLPGGAEIPCSSEFPAAFDGSRLKTSDRVLLPSLGALYEPQPGLRYGIQYRRGYRSGGGRLVGREERVQAYEPERSETLELTHERPLAEALDLRVTAFYSDWRDRQVEEVLPDGSALVVSNIGRASSAGLEAELRGQVGESLEVYAGLGLLRSRFERFPQIDAPELDLRGRRFPGAPSYTLSLSASYRLHQNLRLNGSLYRAGSAFSDAQNSASGLRPGYTLVDLGLRWQRGPLTLDLTVENFFNRRYIERISLAPVTRDAREYRLGAERRLGLELGWRW